jgi:PD-(D/E)XK nuclease superfamily
MRIQRKFEFTEVLGWSYTRYSTFTMCKRRYYFDYYKKWDINNIQKINFLRNLTTVPLEIGNISHKLIQKVLKRLQMRSEKIEPDVFFDYAHRIASDIFKQKRFEEVYYGESDEIDFEGEIYEKVRLALSNFFSSDRLQWLFEEALVTKNEWYLPSENEEDKDFGECRIDRLKAYCKVDFMFPIGEELHILDWKTGKTDYAKHSQQLSGYVGWAHFHFEKDYNLIKPTIAHLLPAYNEHSVVLNDFDLEDFAERVKRETEAMYEFCEVPETNTPIEKERFEMTENTKLCGFCKYRELCHRQ